MVNKKDNKLLRIYFIHPIAACRHPPHGPEPAVEVGGGGEARDLDPGAGGELRGALAE